MKETVISIIAEEFNLDESEITSQSSLRNDLQIDSLAAVKLVFELEGQFGIKITDDELANLATVGDILELLSKKGVTALPK